MLPRPYRSGLTLIAAGDAIVRCIFAHKHPDRADNYRLCPYPLAERDSLFPYTYCLSSSSLMFSNASTRLLEAVEAVEARWLRLRLLFVAGSLSQGACRWC